MNDTRVAHLPRALTSCVLAVGLIIAASAVPARAQAVVASVNDDPITNVDIAQHERILQVLKRPANHDAAFEDVVQTRLKLMETAKFKIDPKDPEIGQAISYTARSLKMDPQQLLNSLQRAGVTQDQWKQRWKAEAAWMGYIHALNRALEVSETEVRGELAKEGKSRAAEYTIRQVIMVSPASAGAAGLQAKLTQAQALRTRFSDCQSGVRLAEAMTDTAVQPPVTRFASALTPQLRKLLDETPVGHLTPPSRGASGIEMLAVCKKSEREDAAAADNLRNDLLAKKLEAQGNTRYKELRAKAIIVRK